MRRSQRRDCYSRLIAECSARQVMARMDAGETAALVRELEEIDSRIFEVQYLPNQAMSLLPINGVPAPGKTEYSYPVMDYSGAAKKITNYATDFEPVDIFAKLVTSAVATFGAKYGYSIQDLEASAFQRIKVPDWKPRKAREVIDRKLDSVLFFGDSESGITGFANNADVYGSAGANLVTLPNGTWSGITGSGSTDGLKLLADLNAIAAAAYNASSGLEQSDTMVIPTKWFNLLSTTPASTTNPLMTVLATFVENQRKINGITTVEFSHQLNTANNAGNGGRIIAFRKDPMKLEGLVPMAFDQTAPQQVGFTWEVFCRAICGGVVIRYPVSVQYCDAAG